MEFKNNVDELGNHYVIEQNDKELHICLGGNGDLYWYAYNPHMKNPKSISFCFNEKDIIYNEIDTLFNCIRSNHEDSVLWLSDEDIKLDKEYGLTITKDNNKYKISFLYEIISKDNTHLIGSYIPIRFKTKGIYEMYNNAFIEMYHRLENLELTKAKQKVLVK